MFESLGVADWVIWYMISQYVGLGLAGGYLLYKKRFKIGFKAVFLRKEKTGWCVVGSKEFKAKDETIKFHKKNFSVDLEQLSYRERGYQYLYIDFEEGTLLTFGGECAGIDPMDADLFLSSGIINRIVAGLKGVSMFSFIILVIMAVVAVLCFFIGLLSSSYLLPEAVEEEAQIIGGLIG